MHKDSGSKNTRPPSIEIDNADEQEQTDQTTATDGQAPDVRKPLSGTKLSRVTFAGQSPAVSVVEGIFYLN